MQDVSSSQCWWWIGLRGKNREHFQSSSSILLPDSIPSSSPWWKLNPLIRPSHQELSEPINQKIWRMWRACPWYSQRVQDECKIAGKSKG